MNLIQKLQIFLAPYLLNSSFSTAAGRWRLIALTNNYSKSEDMIIGSDGESAPPLDRYPDFSVEREKAFLGWTEGATPPAMRALFDDFCDSSTMGMRFVVLENSPSKHLIIKIIE